MSEDDNLILRILKEIQATQAEHGRILNNHTTRFERVERRLDEVHESLYTSFGLAGHANVKTDMLEREISDLRERVKRLEEKA
jgi:hypothetical protein